ncbi:diguanylate cyclase (GGDEF) domain-containing protein [Ruminococcus sp. YE71]|uniref:sensor domain-containing diguanylate cyclase n=1 Tax=unclassified Ruminococcus TaxID=2608920 RepID=UPI0008815A72|nr:MULTISPECIES: GGDEF domain-containing protein [unclassified Ruminococcus]SDA11607.1 diguanylate cyclase (GGDEF) domain-containing protein [Ruminococcus sp. YE78]SFW15495.1 diguanylate cyclase (GGDEF) domain-containing protein [Ruminococcus sp. YE71]
MDLQSYVQQIQAWASVYSFEILPDGTYSDLLLEAVNDAYLAVLTMRPDAPKFYKGIPYRKYFCDVNFEAFCHKCAVGKEPLYSYVNAHGAWISGHYLPMQPEKEGRYYCLYIVKTSPVPDSDIMSERSAEISNAVLNLSIKLHKKQDFIRSIAEIVGDIRKICSSKLCSVALVDNATKSVRFINERGLNQDYLMSLADSMKRTPYEMTQAWEKLLAGSDCLLANDLSIVKERDIVWYNSLVEKGVSSIVLYVIKFNGETVGFIWAANFDSEKMMTIKETLELSTFFMGAVIANYQLLGRLELLSSVDMLTEVSNRNAMNNRVDAILRTDDRPAAMGVVFADLNGLKTVNDIQGHDAGDKLLKCAAGILKIAFGDYEIYRAGGDEFVVFCPDITEAELESRTAELKALADDTHDVSFAAGAVRFDGDYDICKAMQAADAKMYEDKKSYYLAHPDKNWHARE